jgi:hypothetical protein
MPACTTHMPLCVALSADSNWSLLTCRLLPCEQPPLTPQGLSHPRCHCLTLPCLHQALDPAMPLSACIMSIRLPTCVVSTPSTCLLAIVRLPLTTCSPSAPTPLRPVPSSGRWKALSPLLLKMSLTRPQVISLLRCFPCGSIATQDRTCTMSMMLSHPPHCCPGLPLLVCNCTALAFSAYPSRRRGLAISLCSGTTLVPGGT